MQSIVKDIKVQLNILAAKTVSESFDRPNIFYSVGVVVMCDEGCEHGQHREEGALSEAAGIARK